MKLGLKRLAQRIGVDVARHRAPLDLSHVSDIHPLEAAYLAEQRPVLLRVPLEKSLTFGLSAFVPTVHGISPFVHALREWGSGEVESYADSLLKTFYERYQPATAADMYGIEDAEGHMFSTLPPASAPLPWRTHPPAELAMLRMKQIAKDNRDHGIRLDASAGDPFFGPVSSRKGQLEYGRLTGVYESIRSVGFKVDPSGLLNIRVVALVDGEIWRWLVVSAGQHRLAALAALGYEEAIVQLQINDGLGGVILKEHCAQFPLVRKGVVDAPQMRRLFERLLQGKSPPCADAWAQELIGTSLDES